MSIRYYLELIIILGVLAGVLIAVLRLTAAYRRKLYKGEMQVVDRIPVDTGSALVIVAIRGQEYLFSVTGKSVTLHEKISHE